MMVPRKGWKESHLLALPSGEQDWLERKGSRLLDLTVQGVREDTVRDDLSKEVSAFANSGGGQLIYGLADDGQIDGGEISCMGTLGTRPLPNKSTYRTKLLYLARTPYVLRTPVCREGRLHVVGLLRPGARPVLGWDTS